MKKCHACENGRCDRCIGNNPPQSQCGCECRQIVAEKVRDYLAKKGYKAKRMETKRRKRSG